MINLHYTDCMEFMAKCDDYHYDLAPVDPPYGIGESSANHKSRNTPIKQKNGSIMKLADPTYTKKDWDNKPPTDEYFEELFRVSRNQIIWGGNYFKQLGKVFKPPRRKDWGAFIKDNPTGWIIWDKMNGSNDFNDCELAWTSFDRPTYIHQFMWSGMMQGSRGDGSVMEGNKKLNEKRIHPTQKPVRLYEYLIIEYTNKGDLILDTHGGSGSIAIAAYNLNVIIDICEIEQEYFNNLTKRYDNHRSQLLLF